MSNSYVFLADGFEEIEALTVVDVLRRASIDVQTVSVTNEKTVKGAHGITVTADICIADANLAKAPWLILPGGMPGATNLYQCKALTDALCRRPAGQKVAAICAAPAVVLGQLGLLADERATCYPGFEGMLGAKEVVDAPVVVSGRYVLCNGPANALVWALTVVKVDKGAHECIQISNGMLFYPTIDEDMPYTFG